jgi:hypothetical protein
MRLDVSPDATRKKSVAHYETPMINRADFSVSNNNQILLSPPSLSFTGLSGMTKAVEINFVQCGRLRADNEGIPYKSCSPTFFYYKRTARILEVGDWAC